MCRSSPGVDRRVCESFCWRHLIVVFISSPFSPSSEAAVSAVTSALRACGLAGYRNDGDGSVGRQLRDVLSAPLMINNDRILSSLAGPALMSAVPSGLLD